MAAPRKKEKIGSLNGQNIRDILNKRAGREVAFSLKNENPTEVTAWIPTGSRWLDSIICKGKYAGIPVGKIVEIAGLEASGKSYLAALIAANAQKMGMKVIIFDSESSVDPEFVSKLGIDLDSDTFTYVQAESVEFVFETIETLLSAEQNVLYIWDSFANTPCKADMEDANFDPSSSMARKARIASLGMQKLTLQVANANSTLLVLNQLRTNIGDPMQMKLDPWFTPGGKALPYAYSLRIWLTGRKAKDSYLVDENGYRVGSEVKAKIKKSRFGSEGRECFFKIRWGSDPVGISNEEIFDAIKPFLKQTGAWYEIELNEYKKKFQFASWNDLYTNDVEFQNAACKIMDTQVIDGFLNKTMNADIFYDVEKEHA